MAGSSDEAAHNTGECGCEQSRSLCWRRWHPEEKCAESSVYAPPAPGVDAWPAPPDGVRMTFFGVYCKPLDFPEHWVIRRFFVMEGVDRPVADVVPRIGDTLSSVRRYVAPGSSRVDHPDDDPFLHESWVAP